MAVPKTTETRCRDGSVQARHGIQRLQVTPSLHLFFYTILQVVLRDYWEEQSLKPEKRCRDGVTCSLCIPCLACTLPSLHLVSVVFSTAILTSIYTFFENVFILVCIPFFAQGYH